MKFAQTLQKYISCLVEQGNKYATHDAVEIKSVK